MVAVVLVNWNGWLDTIECLDALLPALAPDDRVYIVDNASSDDSVTAIQAWLEHPSRHAEWVRFAGVASYSDQNIEPVAYEIVAADGTKLHPNDYAVVTIIHAGANLGFAGGNNVGLKFAARHHFKWFWLLNTDTVVCQDALVQLLKRATRDDACGLVGSTLLYYREPDKVQALGGGRLELATVSVSHIGEGCSAAAIPDDGNAIEQEMAYVVGASILVSAEFIEKIGFMQEDYFLYFEEIDWAMRGKGVFPLGYAPASKVLHKVGATSSKVMSAFSLNLLYRNRLRFVSRFLPKHLGRVLRSLCAELLRHLIKHRWAEARILARVLLDSRRLITSAPAYERLPK
jgi:GT2 family glycosyltransferase